MRRARGLAALGMMVLLATGAALLGAAQGPPVGPRSRPGGTALTRGASHAAAKAAQTTPALRTRRAVGHPSALIVGTSAWPARLVAPTTTAWPIARSGTDLFWLRGTAAAGSCRHSHATPVRYDPRTRTEVAGARLTGCARGIVAAGGHVWVLMLAGPVLLADALDPKTLASALTAVLPRKAAAPQCACQAMASGGTGPLWVTDGATVWALDPHTGAIKRTFTPAPRVFELAPVPTATALYLSGTAAGGTDVVDEYRSSSGTLVAAVSLPCLGSGGPADVAAGPGTVWTSCPPGTGGVQAYSSDDLAPLSHPTTASVTTGPYSSTAPVGLTVSGDTLWLRSHGSLYCAGTSTGDVRAGAVATTGTTLGAPVVDGSRLYAPLPQGGIVAFTPPPVCSPAG